MDLGVFFEVIVPLMQMRGTATICISTPIGTWNFYSELTELADDSGKPVFNVIKVAMACERCAGTERETFCTHPKASRPDWIPPESYDKVKALYGDRTTLLKREIHGMVTDDENMAFNSDSVKRLFDSASYTEPHPFIETVFVSIDPNGGASGPESIGSETAVISFFYDGPHIVVRILGAAAAAPTTAARGGCAALARFRWGAIARGLWPWRRRTSGRSARQRSAQSCAASRASR